MAARLFEAYKRWVSSHSEALSLIETGVSCLTWVLPDRFADSELYLEVVHTAVNVAASFHDSIIHQADGQLLPGSDLALLLGALEQVQVLVELAVIKAEHQGRISSRYDAMVLVEGIKALVRLLILHCSDTRLLMHGGHANFEGSLAQCRPAGASCSRSGTREVYEAFAGFRSRQCLLDVPTQGLGAEAIAAAGPKPLGNWSQGGGGRGAAGQEPQGDAGSMQPEQPAYWWDRPAALPSGAGADNGSSLQSLEHQFARQQSAAARLIIAGELLHILRPLAHALTLRRWGRASWRPWLLSLALDLLSIQLTAAGARASQRSAAAGALHPAVRGTSLALLFSLQSIRWSTPETQELTRRKVQLLFYLLRDPVFARHVQPALERYQQKVAWVPVLGGLSQKAADIVVGWQQYFSRAVSLA